MSTTFRVEGMTCSGCARAVENAIKTAAPSAAVEVDPEGKRITVGDVDERILVAVVKDAVESAGFTYVGTV